MVRLYTQSHQRPSADVDVHGVPAAGTVGSRSRRDLVLERAGAIGGTHLETMRTRRRVPRVRPLDPRRLRDRGGQTCLVPGVVDTDLDLADAAVRRPGDAGDGDRPGGDVPGRRID